MVLGRTPEAGSPTPSSPPELEPIPAELVTIISEVDREVGDWQRGLSVTIGQARELTGLRESQIRYFEGLDALRPRKSSAQSGANRLFTLAELRRLRVLARLTEQGRRPAEAAELVRTFSHAVDVGTREPVSTIARQERGAVADGFLLARLMSQVIAAAQAELARQGEPTACFQVHGAIMPLRRVSASPEPSATEVAALGDELLLGPADVLVALVQSSDADTLEDVPLPLRTAGDDRQTVLFYSPDPHPLGLKPAVRCCAYIPPQAPEHAVILLISSPEGASPPWVLRPVDETRSRLLNTILDLCFEMSDAFCRSTLSKGYRYRSDGFPLSMTHEDAATLLGLVRRAIFSSDGAALAVLLAPNSLDKPESLSVLAHSGYDDELARRAKLDIRGESPQGLSGRAFVLREPFLSLHAGDDRRIEYAFEEGCTQALAVPLASTWAAAPFGVLYLATRSTKGALNSQRAYMALILGGILAELLGRWWMTRLRRDLDATLHQRLDSIVGWLDSLDERGPNFERGLQELSAIWREIAASAEDSALRRRRLTLAVLDIDHYRKQVQTRSAEPLPLQVQQHVSEAIGRVAPHLRAYWFKNDHALLILPGLFGEPAADLLARIGEQVAITPLDLPGQNGTLRSITVSIAYKELTYKALHDLGANGEARLHEQIGGIVKQLAARTGGAEPGALIAVGTTRRPVAALVDD